MPRRGCIKKRKIAEDPVYGNTILHKFINKITYDGKKSKAEKIMYAALEIVGAKLAKDPLDLFMKALENVSPLLEVKARRVGGATYQIPIEVSKSRSQAIGMQWLREAARDRGGKSMIENLSSEIMDACSGTGGAMKKKEDLHKTAEANKAFAHFRW